MTPDEQFFKLAHIKPYPVEETPAKVTRRIRIAALTADNDSLEKQLKRAKLERNVAAVLALAFFFIWSGSLHAQVTASFSPGQKMARGVYRWSMTACSTEAVAFDAGWAYQAAQHAGIPALQVTQLSRMAGNKGPLAITIITLQFASQFAAYLASSGAIAAKPRLVSDLLLLAGASAEAGSLLKNLPADYVANMLVGTVVIPAGGCVTRDIFVRKVKAPVIHLEMISVPKKNVAVP